MGEENEISSERPVRVNRQIRARQVRLIGVAGEQIGVTALNDALTQAQEADLDLVELNPNADPPVCRIMDYGKYLFQMNKKKAAAKKKQKQAQIKELKFRPGIEEGDYQVKLRKLVMFLEEGDKVKVTVRFRGREMSHSELGFKIFERLQGDIADRGVIESKPRFEGRQVAMIISGKKK